MIDCNACNRPLGVQMVLPDEVWAQISGGDYALCAMCMDERMQANGIRCEADAFFRGKALTTRITPEIQSAVMRWRVASDIKL